MLTIDMSISIVILNGKMWQCIETGVSLSNYFPIGSGWMTLTLTSTLIGN